MGEGPAEGILGKISPNCVALLPVMRGHSPSKTGVNALVTRAPIILRKDGLPVSPLRGGPAMTG
jgi:hypothetical protein